VAYALSDYMKLNIIDLGWPCAIVAERQEI